MLLENVLNGLSAGERDLVLVGAGAKPPTKKRELLNGGLARYGFEGFTLVKVLRNESIRTLRNMGRMYLERIGVMI